MQCNGKTFCLTDDTFVSSSYELASAPAFASIIYTNII